MNEAKVKCGVLPAGRRTTKPPRPRQRAGPIFVQCTSFLCIASSHLQTKDYSWLVSLVTADSSKTVYPPCQTRLLPGRGKGKSKMSLYQSTLELRPAVRFPTFLTKAWAEFLLALRTPLVVDALFSLALVVLPMVAMVLLMFLIGSADPTVAVAADGTGMLILPP
jgi:hypothetical protein